MTLSKYIQSAQVLASTINQTTQGLKTLTKDMIIKYYVVINQITNNLKNSPQLTFKIFKQLSVRYNKVKIEGFRNA